MAIDKEQHTKSRDYIKQFIGKKVAIDIDGLPRAVFSTLVDITVDDRAKFDGVIIKGFGWINKNAILKINEYSPKEPGKE